MSFEFFPKGGEEHKPKLARDMLYTAVVIMGHVVIINPCVQILARRRGWNNTTSHLQNGYNYEAFAADLKTGMEELELKARAQLAEVIELPVAPLNELPHQQEA